MSFDIQLTCKEFSDLSFSRRDKRFYKVFLEDSMVDYFPVCRFLIDDTEGLFSERTGYVEGLTFNVKIFDNVNLEFIESDFFWSDNTLEVSRGSSAYVNGIYEMYLTSALKRQDSIKSKAYKGRFSDIVKKIYSKYQFPYMPAEKNLFISQCDNNDTWFQANESDAELVDRETGVCFSKSFPTSPFISFFNLRSEFYFMPFLEFFTSKQPKRTLFLAQDATQKNSANYITAYSSDVTGATIKYPMYNMDNGYTNENGEFQTRNTTLADYALKVDNNSKGIIPLNKKELLVKRGNQQFGLVESTRLNNLRGKINASHREVLFGQELTIQTNAGIDLAAGDIISTQIDSIYRDKKTNMLYTGKWLVLKHVLEFTPFDASEQPKSLLILVKPTIPIPDSHPLYNTFVKGK